MKSLVYVAPTILAVASSTQIGTCSALVSQDQMFAQADKSTDLVLAQTSAVEVSPREESDITLAQIQPILLPTHPDMGNKYILDSEQLRILPRERQIWNGDLTSIESGPPMDGEVAVSGWRLFWGGVQNSDIAIEKQQVRLKGNKLILKHWDHVMNYPPACEHAMRVINVHLSQLKIYQDDLEKHLSKVDSVNTKQKQILKLHKWKSKIRKEKHRLVKKKLKSIMAGLNCKHAKAKHMLHASQKANNALKKALDKQNKNLHNLRKIAKLSIHKAAKDAKAQVVAVKASAAAKLSASKYAATVKLNKVKALAKTLLEKQKYAHRATVAGLKAQTDRLKKAAMQAVNQVVSKHQKLLAKHLAAKKAYSKQTLKATKRMVKANKAILKAHDQIKKMKAETAAALLKEKAKRAAVVAKARGEKLKLMLAAKAAMKKIKHHTQNQIQKAVKETLRQVNRARSRRGAKSAVKRALKRVVRKAKVSKSRAIRKINKQIKIEKKKLNKSHSKTKGKGKKAKTKHAKTAKPTHKSVHGILKHNSRRKLAKKVAQIHQTAIIKKLAKSLSNTATKVGKTLGHAAVAKTIKKKAEKKKAAKTLLKARKGVKASKLANHKTKAEKEADRISKIANKIADKANKVQYRSGNPSAKHQSKVLKKLQTKEKLDRQGKHAAKVQAKNAAILKTVNKDKKKENKADKKNAKLNGVKNGNDALAIARRDSKLVHKFLRLAAEKTGANKRLIAIASKQDDALGAGITAASRK